jgi:hypothetical protein
MSTSAQPRGDSPTGRMRRRAAATSGWTRFAVQLTGEEQHGGITAKTKEIRGSHE